MLRDYVISCISSLVKCLHLFLLRLLYNKKKIHFFFVMNMTIVSPREVTKNVYFRSGLASPGTKQEVGESRTTSSKRSL